MIIVSVAFRESYTYCIGSKNILAQHQTSTTQMFPPFLFCKQELTPSPLRYLVYDSKSIGS